MTATIWGLTCSGVPGGDGSSGGSTSLKTIVPVSNFGAIGDGLTDDTVALQAAITSGSPLNWGSGVYRITSKLVGTYESSMIWVAYGAKIFLDSPVVQQQVVLLNLGEGEHSILGQLKIDANLKAYCALNFEGTATAGTLHLDNVYVTRAYRSGTVFPTGADGILTKGPFKSVTFDNCSAEDCRLAEGAGTPGTYGVFGFSFLSNTFGQAALIEINNPKINKIWCEDNTYVADQDGIRVIAPSVEVGSNVTEQTLIVTGGKIKNAYGRGIKSQCEMTTIIGTTFIRTQGFARGYGNEEIDIQEGGGLIKDIQCLYTGSCPEIVVQLVTARVLKKTGNAIIDGAHVFIGTGITLPRFFTTSTVAENAQVTTISNVSVVGEGSLTVLGAFYGAYNKEFHLRLSDIVAAPAVRLVNVVLRDWGSATGTLTADRIVNTGPTPVDLISQSPAWPVKVSATELTNFTEYIRGYSILGDLASGAGFTSMVGIIPRNTDRAGVARPYSFTLLTGQTYTIPSGTCIGTATASNLLMIATSDGTRNSQAIIAAGADGTQVLAGGASSTWVGSTTINEPISGTYRIWRNAGINIKSYAVNPVTFTIWYIG